MTNPVRVSILGATGSVGQSALDVVSHPRSDGGVFEVTALTANKDVSGLARAARACRAEIAVIADPSLYKELSSALAGSGVEVAAGPQALDEAAQRGADCVIAAIVGIAGLSSTLKAIQSGADVALANKESMVCAGPLLKRAAAASGSRLLPIDSEHNAIFQVLDASARVEKLILTASGGPFRLASMDAMRRATPAEAIKHPNWSMGAKISVDCATMLNKGLELIEAVHLFDVSEDRIEILIHPQSIVHSLVQYDDGSVLAQMGMPDMRIPISYALSWPHRMPLPGLERLDLAKIGRLDFEQPDYDRFPALNVSRQAAAAAPGASILLNGANEVAVSAFLEARIGFLDIVDTISDVLDRGQDVDATPADIADVLAIDAAARSHARERLRLHA